jgi:hypothetical protein
MVTLPLISRDNAARRYASTSETARGCAITRTQRGITITGNRSTNARIISKERLPEPMMM